MNQKSNNLLTRLAESGEYPEKTYTVKVYCHNCGGVSRLNIPFGQIVSSRSNVCPKCGCASLRRCGGTGWW